MTSPQICVVIPAYNQAKFLGEAINSVISQSYTDFELVVVDDGSTDDTPQVLAGFQDPRMRTIRQENKGLAGARNTGIRHSSAPLLSFLDSDDLFLPNNLAILHTYLEEHPQVGFVSGGRCMIDANEKVINQVVRETGIQVTDILLNNPFAMGSSLVRREWLEQVGLFDESLRACEDWDIYLRLALGGCRMAWIEKIIMAYRFHPGQMTRELSRMRRSRMAVLEKFFSQPDLPGSIWAYYDRAVAAVLVKVAALAFLVGEYEVGKADLGEAVRLDPLLAEQGYRRLVKALMGWAYAPHVSDPEAFLMAVVSHLPEGLGGLRPALRQALAAVLLEPFFRGRSGDWRANKMALLRALWYNPAWLFNRGVMRILVEAWLPM